MSGFNAGGMGQGILSISIRDTASLYAAYIPYIQNGGIFVPTNRKYRLGDEVFILLSLLDETEKTPVSGKVVWITPAGAQGNRAAGVGVQFSEQESQLLVRIETYLVTMLSSDRPTHTM